jgi:hypothetical protein
VVRLTWSPSRISAPSPISTAPTESSSRFKASPSRRAAAPGARRPCSARGRGCARCRRRRRDRPSLRDVTPAAKPPSCSFRIRVMSSARISMSPLSCLVRARDHGARRGACAHAALSCARRRRSAWSCARTLPS